MDDRERFIRLAVVVRPLNIDEDLSKGRGQITLEREELVSRLLEETPGRMDSDWDSLTVERVELGPAVERPMKWSEMCETLEDVLKQITDRLDARVAQVTEEFLIGIVENLDNNHNMSFFRDLSNEPPESFWPPF